MVLKRVIAKTTRQTILDMGWVQHRHEDIKTERDCFRSGASKKNEAWCFNSNNSSSHTLKVLECYSTDIFSITRFFLILAFSKALVVNFIRMSIAVIISWIHLGYLFFFSSSFRYLWYLFAASWATYSLLLYKLV